MPSYTKPFLSLADQLETLKSRGLHVEDDAAAIECLHRNGYYRLSAYWYPFREIVGGQRTNNFLPDSKFEDAVELYIFDKEFKLLLLDAIERVEIAVRVEIALLLGARNPFAHTEPATFHTRFITHPVNKPGYTTWTQKFNDMVARSKDEFVLHYERKYQTRSPLPIWIAIELWDFGLMSHFYSGMRVKERAIVAARFGVPDWEVMESWLRTINYVRNVIAHHGRLWNLSLNVNPKPPRPGDIPDFDVLLPIPNVGTRIYSACCILSHFSHVVNPTSEWSLRLAEKIDSFPVMPYADCQAMGFPLDWRDHNFWK
jgi:abortive infection bacteriophage resistance protein